VRWCAPLLVTALLSCASKASLDWTELSAPQRQQTANEVALSCGLPPDRIQILGDNLVNLNLQPTDPNDRAECLLRRLNSVKGIKLGFVGNETYSNEVN